MNTYIYALYEGIGLWFDDSVHLSTSLGQVGVIAFDWPGRRAQMLVHEIYSFFL